MTDIERLRALGEKARAWRLAGDHHEGRDAEFPLIGKCFDNAYVAYHFLEDKGYDVRFVEGTTDRVADEFIQMGERPEAYESTEMLAGNVHYWVEVYHAEEGQWYVFDIASDTHDRLGAVVVEPLAEATDYLKQPDSVDEGERSLRSARERGDRCRYCGDQRYTRGGCPDCHDDIADDLR